jgi:alpha-D-ribose 1-methylphosphonate 5-triphosphate synthase subunit PhnL
MTGEPLIMISGLYKTFTLHHQGGVRLPVLANLRLTVRGGECVVLHGPSGTGKSTLLRSIYANYKPQAGTILVRHNGAWVNVVRALPQAILQVRQRTMGYVSQFLRLMPRVPAVDVVSEPLRLLGVPREEARERARTLLARLDIPGRLWDLAPATFSGGEQQRVNIARGFVYDYPVLLLDEPTASLEAENRARVIELIHASLARGTAIVGIFHDETMPQAVGTRLYSVITGEIS